MKDSFVRVFALVSILSIFAFAEAEKTAVLFDFEKADELKCFQLDGPGKDAMKAELAADNKTSGKTCLKVTYPNDGWADIQFTKFNGDWSNYNMLKMDIFNPTKNVLGIQFQGADKNAGISKEAYFGDPDKRVSATFMLRGGKNEVMVPLKFDRPFDLKNVKMWSISTMSRPAGLILYIDNIRLEKGNLKYEE